MNLFEWLRNKTSGKTDRQEVVQRIQALISEGQTYLTREDYAQARGVFLKLLGFRDYLKSTWLLDHVLLSLERTWFMTEQYAEAIMFFSEHISRYPVDLTAYLCRADAFWYTGEVERSISDYSRVLGQKSRDVLALSGRGQVLVEAGKFTEALKDLDYALQLIKKGPTVDPYWVQYHQQIEPFIHRARGVALAGLGDHAAALKEFNLSLTQCPENAWAYYSRAEFYEASGEPEKAAADYRLALEKTGPALNPIRRERARARLKI